MGGRRYRPEVQLKEQPEPAGGNRAPGRIGRPVDRSKDAKILAITLDALADRPYDQVTVDSIALQAATAKTTLYRRWPTKTALMLAAVASAGEPPEAERLPDEGSVRADLIAVVDSPWLGGHQRRIAIFSGLAHAARGAPELADAVRARVTAPYIGVYRALLQRAVDRELLPRTIEHRIELLAEVIPAMSTQRLDGDGGGIDRAYYLALIDDVLLPSLHATPPS